MKIEDYARVAPEDRASLGETLEFANKVRKAGGGSPLDALLPGIGGQPKSCLIARALNFSCQIETASVPGVDIASVSAGHFLPWVMFVKDRGTRLKIAEQLDLPLVQAKPMMRSAEEAILIPAEIGAVAEAFDSAAYMLRLHKEGTPDERKVMDEFAPYVDSVGTEVIGDQD